MKIEIERSRQSRVSDGKKKESWEKKIGKRKGTEQKPHQEEEDEDGEGGIGFWFWSWKMNGGPSGFRK